MHKPKKERIKVAWSFKGVHSLTGSVCTFQPAAPGSNLQHPAPYYFVYNMKVMLYLILDCAETVRGRDRPIHILKETLFLSERHALE